MRPTGRLHIGHMVGALDNWVQLQHQYDSYFFVADWHALTTKRDTREMRQDAIEMVRDWIAAGIDPQKSTLFVQSMVPQHAELHVLFSMLNTLTRLERVPTFKGQMNSLLGLTENEEPSPEQIASARSQISYGFLGYPVLQAADILIYKADGVPVGEDQIPHIELTREIARTFNKTYGNVFPEPEALLTPTPKILGTDGRKMSKSYKNTILPTDSPEEVRKKVGMMVTDPARKRLSDPGDPNKCSVYEVHFAYNDQGIGRVQTACVNALRGCGECKLEAANCILARYQGHAERRAQVSESMALEILIEGSKRARAVAQRTIDEVKDYMLMTYTK